MLSIEEMEKELKKYIPNMEKIENIDGEKILSQYLGSYMSLDPCGKYHHILSPNDVVDECCQYWENLEKAAENLGGYITSGEGDPTDIFFELPVYEEEN
jgi:hypothetical protein